MEESSRQEINKDILELNNTIDLMNMTNVYRVFHPATAEYTFFLTAQGTFSKKRHYFRSQSKSQSI
jgi:hypothetical protein